jgi:FixJ family two-component response regulator
MTLVVKGLMNKEVGSTLDISETTVKAHRGRVMQKMQATTLVDLVNMAAELGIRDCTRCSPTICESGLRDRRTTR